MKKDNITELKDHILPDGFVTDELSDEMLQAYLEACDMDTPDMWSRIEAGFEEEIKHNKYSKENKNKWAVRRKIYGIAAAVFLVVIVAVPVMLNRFEKSEKSDKQSDMIYNNESCELEDEACEIAEGDMMADEETSMQGDKTYVDNSIEENDMMTSDEYTDGSDIASDTTWNAYGFVLSFCIGSSAFKY